MINQFAIKLLVESVEGEKENVAERFGLGIHHGIAD